MANPRERDLEMFDRLGDTTEGAFQARSDLTEGISGKAKIDTTYENTVRCQVKRPRSDSRPRNAIGSAPAPRNYTGDEYHGEWDDSYSAPAQGPEFVW